MPSALAQHWTLDPAVAHLNHGSFGATPRPVLEAQLAWRDRMEADPTRFFAAELERALDEARGELAAFVGGDAEDLAWVPNATTGVNTVLRSLRLEPGDELLTTDHEYNAVRNALQTVAAAAGANVVVARVPFPIAEADEVVQEVLSHVTRQTRLAVIDHVTSATALVFPIARLVAALEERGVDTLVDGAHGPGMVDVDVSAIGAAYYTGNCHKWLSAPKGSAFLHVRRDRRDAVHPLAVSHGANSPRTDRSRFRLEFDWTGTADPTPYLAVPAAIRFVDEAVSGGWPEARDRCHRLALAARDLVCAAVGVDRPAPNEMIGAMASVPFPPSEEPFGVQGVDLYRDPIHEALLREHAMQTAITPWPTRPDSGPWRRLIRLSAALYNDRAEFERLATVLPGVLEHAALADADRPVHARP